MTGETFPVEKSTGILAPETPLSQRTNSLFMGTHVVSGSARAVVVRTGKETEFGKVSERLRLRPPETEFERGVRRFGYLLMEITLVLVIAIFAVNVFLTRPVLDSFLFALALAVGLTSQLLPAITVLVIRTRKPFFRSKPGKYLLMATLLVVVATVLFPMTPFAGLLGFQLLPIKILLVIGMIVVIYIIAAEIVKRSFYKRVNF